MKTWLAAYSTHLGLGRLIHLHVGIFVWRDGLGKRCKILNCKISQTSAKYATSWLQPKHSLNIYRYVKELFKRKNALGQQDPAWQGFRLTFRVRSWLGLSHGHALSLGNLRPFISQCTRQGFYVLHSLVHSCICLYNLWHTTHIFLLRFTLVFIPALFCQKVEGQGGVIRHQKVEKNLSSYPFFLELWLH